MSTTQTVKLLLNSWFCCIAQLHTVQLPHSLLAWSITHNQLSSINLILPNIINIDIPIPTPKDTCKITYRNIKSISPSNLLSSRSTTIVHPPSHVTCQPFRPCYLKLKQSLSYTWHPGTPLNCTKLNPANSNWKDPTRKLSVWFDCPSPSLC